jgi:hypothetical protein
MAQTLLVGQVFNSQCALIPKGGEMMIKSILVVIAFFGFLGVAQAQPALQSLERRSSLTGAGEVANGAHLGTDAITAATVSGWNFVHPAYCWATFDAATETTWFYVITVEGGYWFTNNFFFQNMLAPACQTGNRIAFYIFDPILVQWSQVITYPFK